MILSATKVLCQWSLQLMIPNEEKRGRHMDVLLVGRWESRIAHLWSLPKHKPTHLQRHAGMTSLPIINIQAWFFEKKKNQNVCYYVQIRLFFGATIFHTYYSYCTCACVKFEIIDRFLKSLLPIIYRNY